MLISLMAGNADGLGAQRIDELYYSCSLMGIPQHCVTFVDDVALQDGQYVKWDEVLVGSYVMEMCEIVKPDMVCFFCMCCSIPSDMMYFITSSVCNVILIHGTSTPFFVFK